MLLTVRIDTESAAPRATAIFALRDIIAQLEGLGTDHPVESQGFSLRGPDGYPIGSWAIYTADAARQMRYEARRG